MGNEPEKWNSSAGHQPIQNLSHASRRKFSKNRVYSQLNVRKIKMSINPENIKQFKIARINVNSLIANYRRLELLQFLERHRHDIIFLSQTKLNHSHVNYFKDYEIIRRDRPNATQGGGTAILIKKNILFEIVNFPSSFANEILEYTCLCNKRQ